MANGEGYCYSSYVKGLNFSFNGVNFVIDEVGNVWREEVRGYSVRYRYIDLTYRDSIVTVTLNANKKRKTISLARLILQAKEGEAQTDDLIAMHIDGDKDNHRVENLKWVTRKEFYSMGKSLDNKSMTGW